MAGKKIEAVAEPKAEAKTKDKKEKEVSNDDEGERKKLVKEVKELLKQKGKKWSGYTTYSIKNLKKGIEDLRAMPDKK